MFALGEINSYTWSFHAGGTSANQHGVYMGSNEIPGGMRVEQERKGRKRRGMEV